MGKDTYKLMIKENDGKEAFWTGKMPYQSFVECSLTESNLDVTIERVVGTYLPIKYVMASDGPRNLTTDRKKRVTLLSSIRCLFGPGVKDATLYLHFGGVFDAGFHHKNEQYFREAMKQLNESFNAPGFWNSHEGSIAKTQMRQLESELQKPYPNMGAVQKKLQRVNKFIGTSVAENQKNLKQIKQMKTALMILVIVLPVCIIAGFVYCIL